MDHCDICGRQFSKDGLCHFAHGNVPTLAQIEQRKKECDEARKAGRPIGYSGQAKHVHSAYRGYQEPPVEFVPVPESLFGQPLRGNEWI